MKMNEAIKWLRESEVLDLTDGDNKDREAVDLAIKSLEAWAKLKPELNAAGRFGIVPGTNMADAVLLHGYKAGIETASGLFEKHLKELEGDKKERHFKCHLTEVQDE